MMIGIVFYGKDEDIYDSQDYPLYLLKMLVS